VRSEAGGPVEAILVLGTEGAPPRRRRAQRIDHAEPEPVPTARATIVRPEPFASGDHAAAWLAALRGNEEGLDAELRSALVILNRALRAQRAAAADPYVADVSAERALVVRLGYGGGAAVADGRFGEALELPRAGARGVKRSMEAPEELFAALLGGHRAPLAAEELVLRARADLTAGREREAALQARVAIEALLAETGTDALEEERQTVIAAAAAVLEGERPEGVEHTVAAMEGLLRRRRLGS
jgi:hypothetical protein